MDYMFAGNGGGFLGLCLFLREESSSIAQEARWYGSRRLGRVDDRVVDAQ